MTQTLAIFPGQGSQYPRMGQDLYQNDLLVRELYQQANDCLGYDLRDFSWGEHQQANPSTRYTQPLVFVHSVACYLLWQKRCQPTSIVAVAGHSLGEYTALWAAGVLSFENALALVNQRGQCMEQGQGRLLAINQSAPTIEALSQHYFCQVSAYNTPQQTVVGGLDQDLMALEQVVKQQWPRARCTRLATQGAFHTYYMVSAAQRFRDYLQSVAFGQAQCPVISNVTGQWHTLQPDALRSQLFFQLFQPVRWFEGLGTALQKPIDQIIEFGGGTGPDHKRRGSLQALNRQINRQIPYKAAVDWQSLQGIKESTL